jgi:hypothetical protein
MRRFALAVFLVSSMAQAKPPAPSPALNRQVAVAANTLGMQRYRTGDVRGAAEQFRVAIESDDSYVNAHYNLACVASRMGDPSTALKELSWLSGEPDPLKHTKLEKAKTDPDLDFVSALPQAREQLGLPPFEKSRPSLWLAERGGVWSAELPAEGCQERSYTLIFHDDGQVLLRVHEQCGDKLGDGEFHGKLQLTPVAVVIADWKAWPGEVPLSFAPCPGTQAAGACFLLAGSRSQLGPFHRGLPFPRNTNHR